MYKVPLAILALLFSFSQWLQAHVGDQCVSHLQEARSFRSLGGETRFEDKSFLSEVLPGGYQGPWLVRYRVILPKDYDPAKKYGVVYFLHGRSGDRFVLDTIGISAAFRKYTDQGGPGFILATMDGGDNYWMNAARKNARWSDVVTVEFIRAVEQSYSVMSFPAGRILAGVSMGGHGAIQNVLNHPGIYGAVAAHSPVFRTQDEASREFYDQFGAGIDFQNRDPFSLIIFRGKQIDVPLWIDIGGQDFALANTKNFAQLVRERKYQAELHVGEDRLGGHALEYWQYHLLEYLWWYGRHLPSPYY